MNQELIYKTLLAPRVTEKSAARDQQYVFKVLATANKLNVKQAVETVFGVKVKHVRTLNTKGKPTNFGRTKGNRKSWKKAYVTLMPGQHIALAGE